jgi:hypothetical protein
VSPIIAGPKGINVYTPDPQDKLGYKAACECSMPISIKDGIQMYHVTAAHNTTEISQVMRMNCYDAVNIYINLYRMVG